MAVMPLPRACSPGVSQAYTDFGWDKPARTGRDFDEFPVYLAAPPGRTPRPSPSPIPRHTVRPARPSDRKADNAPRPRGRRPRPRAWVSPLPHGSGPRRSAEARQTPGVCGPGPHRGGWGGVPQQRTGGRESERSSLNRNKWSPSPGGRARGTTRSGPGGVGRFRSTVKLKTACMPQIGDHPVKELQHIWVRSEQTFWRIVCRYRIFLAGRYWRDWPQGLGGSVGFRARLGRRRGAVAPSG
jgi:hypothetical protein